MGAPYSSTTVSGYNDNPPPDDGTVSEANRGKWATIKTKIGDPLNTFAAAINSAISTAFGRVIGGAGVTSTASNLTLTSADQGKLIRATASGITITTPSAVTVGSPFVFGILNDSSGDITVDGSGAQTIDGDASFTLVANAGVQLNTDGTNWFTFGQNAQRTQIAPQGYLSLVAIASNALSPVPTGDVSAATSVFYRPLVGDLVPIPNGTVFTVREFTELTLTMAAQHVANAIYDVFVWSESGVVTIGTGPTWTTVTAGSGSRGTGAGTSELFMLKGLPVNNVQITTRNGASTFTVAARSAVYVGSIFMDGTNGQISCHVSYGQSRKWGVFNAYNRLPVKLLGGDSTVTWTNPGATVRASNATSNNKVTSFLGLADQNIRGEFTQKIQTDLVGATGSSIANAEIGIGVNVTTAFSGKVGVMRAQQGNGAASTISQVAFADGVASHDLTPALGIQNIQSLESSTVTNGTVTMHGAASYMLLSATWMG